MARVRGLRAVVLALVAVGAASCAATPPAPSFPPLTWSQPPIRLDVADIRVQDDYVPPLAPPNVEHLFPLLPSKAMADWAHQRLQAAGAQGQATFVIKTAQVIQHALKTKGGLTGLLTDQQSARYDMTLAADLEVRYPGGGGGGVVHVESQVSRTVPQSLSVDGREKVWYAMTEEAMKALNQGMERQITRHMADFVKP